MRRLAALAVLAAVTLAACTSGTGSADEGAGRCAAGPVALWSSQEASPSHAVVVGRSGPVATRTIDAMGLDVRPGEFAIGDHRYLLASGDSSHATTVLVDWRANSCTVATVRLDGVVLPLGFATDGTRFFTTNTRNGYAEFRRFDAAGTMAVETKVADTLGTVIVLVDTTLYAFVTEVKGPGSDAYGLLELDATTLNVRSRRPLPMVTGQVGSVVAHGGRLIVAATAQDGTTATPGHTLVVLDPLTLEARTVDLGADLPDLLRVRGDTLYVGHTFINPAFGELSTLRHLSVVDLTTFAVTGHDLDAGILDFRVDDSSLYLLGWLQDNALEAVVQTYRLGTLDRTASVSLPRPTAGGGLFYPAGLLQP